MDLTWAAAPSQALFCDRSLAGIVGSNSASCECYASSGGRLWVGLIIRREDSYRIWSVWVWSWNLDIENALAN